MTPRPRRPALRITIPLEGDVLIALDARCLEDEMRLRHWLRRSRRLVYLQHVLQNLLDDLDELKQEDRAA